MTSMEIYPLETKKVDSLDIYKSLKQFLVKHYGQDVAKDYDNSLTNIQQHRTELRNLQDKSEGARDLLLKYALELAYIERRFPINSGSERINIQFSWYDAFAKRYRTSQGNIFFEQASVLYNAAVLECQLGCAETRSTDDSIKNAVKNFQNAAGLFLFVKEKVCTKIVEKISNDLTNESLDCLSALMLANAQQCIVEKADKGKMKPAILSKLAASASDLFAQANKLMTSPSLSDQFDKNWKGYARFKELYFDALANYYVSRDLHERDEIGKEIARLKKALAIMEEAKNGKISASLYSSAKQFIEILNKAYDAAEFDNQKVYHERVPDANTLEIIEKKDLAKANPVDLATMVSVADPFDKLFPIRVMEFRVKFFDTVNANMNQYLRMAREHRDKIKQKLDSLGLPGSILAAEQKQGFPDQIYQKIAKINQTGGLSRIAELKQNVDDMATCTREMIESLRKKIDEEQEDDNQCRAQFGAPRWTRHPSAMLNVNIRKTLDEYTNKLNQARKSDELIQNKLTENHERFLRFALDKHELDKLMPHPDLSDGSDTLGKAYQDLKVFLQQIDHYFAAEEQIEAQIKQQHQDDKDNIDKRLLQSQDNLDNALIQEVARYDALFKEFNRIALEEDAVIAKVEPVNAQFEQSRKHSNSIQKREAVIQDMMTGINKYDEVISNLQEGARFYSSMQDIIRKLQQKIDDFVAARKLEKSDLISNIQSQATGVNAQYNQPPQPQQASQVNTGSKFIPQQQPYYNPQQNQYVAPQQQQVPPQGYVPQQSQIPQQPQYTQAYVPQQGYIIMPQQQQQQGFPPQQMMPQGYGYQQYPAQQQRPPQQPYRK